MPRMKKNEIIRRLLQEKFQLKQEFLDIQEANKYLQDRIIFLVRQVGSAKAEVSKLEKERAQLIDIYPDLDLELLRRKLMVSKPE